MAKWNDFIDRRTALSTDTLCGPHRNPAVGPIAMANTIHFLLHSLNMGCSIQSSLEISDRKPMGRKKQLLGAIKFVEWNLLMSSFVGILTVWSKPKVRIRWNWVPFGECFIIYGVVLLFYTLYKGMESAGCKNKYHVNTRSCPFAEDINVF